MDWLHLVALVVGVALVVASFVDVLWSTLGTGGGPLLRRLGRSSWRMALWMHFRVSKSHGLLRAYGVGLVVGALLTWVMLHWLGWTLILWSQPSALATQAGVPASLGERLYFVGQTMATLGRGDLVVASVFWKLAAVVIALQGIFIVTLVISFFIPVTQTEAKKRSVARMLCLAGSTPQEMVVRAMREGGLGDFNDVLRGLVRDLVLIRERYVTYPLLHFLHTPDPERAFALRLVILDEALTILRFGVQDCGELDNRLFEVARSLVEDFLDTLPRLEQPDDNTPPAASLDALRREGISTRSEEEWSDQLERLAGRRMRLRALVRTEGWEWSDVTGERRDPEECG